MADIPAELQTIATLCPHCDQSFEPGNAFCPSCGLAVPSLRPSVPRILQDDDVAATPLGRLLQVEGLRKQTGSASVPLLFVAIIQMLSGLALLSFFLFGDPEDRGDGDNLMAEFMDPAVVVAVIFVGFLFFLLYLWARKNPFPAAIVGLGLFVTVHLVDALADPSALVRGMLMKIIIISLLVKAISAGAKHRRLTRGVRAT